MGGGFGCSFLYIRNGQRGMGGEIGVSARLKKTKKELMAFEQEQDGEGWKKNGKKLGEALYKVFCM